MAVYDWRFVFLISEPPFGLLGTAWSYWKLRELAVIKKGQKLDVWGNVCFALGLTIFLVGMTYSLIPFGSSAMGWGNPSVIGCLAVGLGLLIAFPIIEARAKDPMFSMDLFKNRGFSRGSRRFRRGSFPWGRHADAGDPAPSDLASTPRFQLSRYSVLAAAAHNSHAAWASFRPAPLAGGFRTRKAHEAWLQPACACYA